MYFAQVLISLVTIPSCLHKVVL